MYPEEKVQMFCDELQNLTAELQRAVQYLTTSCERRDWYGIFAFVGYLSECAKFMTEGKFVTFLGNLAIGSPSPTFDNVLNAISKQYVSNSAFDEFVVHGQVI